MTHPVVVILAYGAKCTALLDTGAVSSNVLAGLMNALKKKPMRKDTKHIEMMMNFITKNIEIFKV